VRLLKLYRNSYYKTDEYQLLKRVFLELYEMDDQHKVILLENEKISAGSVQSHIHCQSRSSVIFLDSENRIFHSGQQMNLFVNIGFWKKSLILRKTIL
jgi:hypothetical protein